MTDLASATRFDAIRFDAPKKTAAGYLRASARLTRAGVFAYRAPDGSVVRELRSPDEVFHADSLDSLRMVPLTDTHPAGNLDSSKARNIARGTVGSDVRQDENFVIASLNVFDADLVTKIENGTARELSCGYKCLIDPTPGVWNGEAYDVKQTNIRYDHVAVVEKGRAGPQVAIRMDSQDFRVAMVANEIPQTEEKQMAKIKVGGAEFECSDDLAKALSAESAKESVNAFEKEKARADALEAEVKQLKESAPKIPELVKARVSLEREAAKFVAAEKLDGLSDIEVKKAVVAAILPGIDLKDASDSYVDGSYTTALKLAESRGNPALGKAREAVTARADAGETKSAHDKMVERQANAWKGSK